jgi:phosphoribosylamine-glycine ligase
MSLNILLLGSGGREHALAWRLSQSNLVQHIYVCPGNGGTISQKKCSNLDKISPSDFPSLVQFALNNDVCHKSLLLLVLPSLILAFNRLISLFLVLSSL